MSWLASPDDAGVADYVVYGAQQGRLGHLSADGSASYQLPLNGTKFGLWDQYFVKAVGDNGISSWRTNLTLDACAEIDTTPPSTPRNLRYTRQGDTVTFEWNPSTDDRGIESYRLLIGSNLGSPHHLSTAGDVTTATVDVNELTPGTEYRVQVLAWDGFNHSRRSNLVRITAPADLTRPEPVTHMTLAVDDVGVNIRFDHAHDNGVVVGYQIHRSVDEGPFSVIKTCVAQWLCADRTIEPGHDYAYYIRAVDAAGNVSWRNGIKTISTREGVDNRGPHIGNYFVGTVTDTTAELTWVATDNVAVANQVIKWQERGSDEVSRTQLGVDASSHVITGLKPSTTYTVTMVVTDSSGNVTQAQHQVRTDIDETLRPSVVTKMTAAFNDGAVKLAWNAANSPAGVAHYQIFRLERGQAANEATVIATTPDTSFADTQIHPGTEYGYYIRAATEVDPANKVFIHGWRNGIVYVNAT